MQRGLTFALAAIGAVTTPYAIAAVTAPAPAADELMSQAQELFQAIPEQPPSIPGDEATPAKVELGRMLYFEPRLSESHNISCNSCHQIGLGGVDMLPTSPAID